MNIDSERQKVRYIPINDLLLDTENPRIKEFGIGPKDKQPTILRFLWDEMAVNELVYSIASNGFWEYEPLVIMPSQKSKGKYVVLEGNRRLAAVLMIHGQYDIDRKLPEDVSRIIAENKEWLLGQIASLPCIVVESRKEAWRYIGFKHVNGPAKWSSFAKAQYIARIHNEHKVALEDIAFQLGDTNRTVQRLYQALMVLEQAKEAGVYDYQEEITAPRIYFSHLLTGLGRQGIRSFLDLNSQDMEAAHPIAEQNLRNLGDLLTWLYGSRTLEIRPVVERQNPHLKLLDEVLQKAESTAALRRGESLQLAHEKTRERTVLLEELLYDIKSQLQKAKGYVTEGYDGEEAMLKVSGSVAEYAESIYEEMLSMHTSKKGKGKKTRITE